MPAATTLSQKITAALAIIEIEAADATSDTIGRIALLLGAPLGEVEEIVRDLIHCDGDCDREIGCSACESTWSSSPRESPR